MRLAHLLLLFTLLTSAASAQSFEQLGFLRMNDTTHSTTRSVAIGGTSDPIDDSVCGSGVSARLPISAPRCESGIRTTRPAIRRCAGVGAGGVCLRRGRRAAAAR